MLRAVNIPSRLVSGFKGGIKNQFTGVFEVQERHAHAWVEAYIDGRWVLLDATPAARAESVDGISTELSSWADFKSMVQSFWEEYVVKMSLIKQRESLYKPVKTRISEWWNSVSTGKEGREKAMTAIKKVCHLSSRMVQPQWWNRHVYLDFFCDSNLPSVSENISMVETSSVTVQTTTANEGSNTG